MKSDALLIQQATGPHTYLLDLTHKDHSDYCRKWSFDFWDIRADVTDGNHAYWNKVSLILKAVEARYEKIVWLDSDAYIADPDTDLRQACPVDGIGATWHDGQDWNDERLYDHYNAGVLYIGVGQESKRFLKLWAKTPDNDHPWHDQHSFWQAIPAYQHLWRRDAPVVRLGHEWNATPFYPHDKPIVAAWHGCFPDIERRLDMMQSYINGNRMRRMIEGCSFEEATQKAEFCMSVGNWKGALQFLDRLREIGEVDERQWHLDKGACHYKLKEFAPAVEAYQKVVEIEPTNGPVWQSISSCYDFLGEHEKNGAAIRQALVHSPNWPPVMHNLSLWQLRDGQWRDGFENMKWQYLVRERIARCPGQEYDIRLGTKTLFVWAEQGLGDTLMLSRFVYDILEGFDKIILEVQKPLVSLYKAQCWPNVQIVAQEPEKGVPWQYDAHVGMFTLPHLWGAKVDNVDGKPYLKAPAESVKKWANKFPPSYNDGMCIGFSWAGSSGHGNNENRNMQAGMFDEIIKTPGTRWYSLQRGIEIDAETIADTPEVTFIGDETEDMADVAGILANLDLVITIDSAIAHLCGAMGIPCWVMLSKSSDWRWLTKGSSTVWYESCRLFRQERLGDWQQVMCDVTRALEERLQT